MSARHPAKMNLNLIIWILETFTRPGETVLDPMAGTGSSAILAALKGRRGIAVEYEAKFYEMIRENMALTLRQPWFTEKGEMACIQGDSRGLSTLLEEADIIVSSPPYGNRLSDVAVNDGDQQRMGYRQAVDNIVSSPPFDGGSQGGPKEKFWNKLAKDPTSNRFGRKTHPMTGKRCDLVDAVVIDKRYSSQKENIGNLRGETYLHAMLLVYQESFKVLRPGGRMILVTKNFIRDKRVVRLDLDTIRICEAAGFRLADRWWFRLPWKSFWRINYLYRCDHQGGKTKEDQIKCRIRGMCPHNGREERKLCGDYSPLGDKVPSIEYEDILIFEKPVPPS